MHKLRPAAWTVVTVLLFTCLPRDAGATAIMITASVSDRGLDVFPWDGVGATVFGNPSVVQITTPPIGSQAASEERTAVEFPLGAIPSGSTIDSVMLRLTPVGQTLNIGLSAGEVSEIHGYAGDGLIQVADLMDSLLVASLAGPTPNGQLTVSLSLGWLQNLIDSGGTFGGLMFKGVPGPAAVTYAFDAAFNGVPVAERPTLLVEYHEGAAVPEPAALALLAAGLAALRRRRSAVVRVSISGRTSARPRRSRGGVWSRLVPGYDLETSPKP